MQLPYICCSNSLMVTLPFLSWSFINYASLMYYLSYSPTYLCRWASSASNAAVDGYWNVKSNSSILTAVGSVVSRCSKELSAWEMGMIAGSSCWYTCTSEWWQISGCYCWLGAGRASTLGDDSISVSLIGSVAVRVAIRLV